MPSWLQDLVARWSWTEAGMTALIVAAAWGFGRAFGFLLARLSHRWKDRSDQARNRYVLDAVRGPLARLIVLLGVYLAIHRYTFGALRALDGILFVATVLLIMHMLVKSMG